MSENANSLEQEALEQLVADREAFPAKGFFQCSANA